MKNSFYTRNSTDPLMRLIKICQGTYRLSDESELYKNEVPTKYHQRTEGLQ